MRGFFLLVGLIAAAFAGGGAAIAAPSTEEVTAALRNATDYLNAISVEGGYRRDALDPGEADDSETLNLVWVESPGTPQVGEALLAAWAATGHERHLDAAAAAADALVRGQLESGGWDRGITFDPDERDLWAYRVGGAKVEETRHMSTMFANDTTPGALRFLIAFLDVADEHEGDLNTDEIHEAVLYGLDRIIDAQYPNGAWPQRFLGELEEDGTGDREPGRIPDDWPREWLRETYIHHYTLNDEAIGNCIRTLLAAWKWSGEGRFLKAAREGGKFLIAAQFPEPQAGWAQQYNFDMEPAWARPYEPPAVASRESAEAVRVLLELYVATEEEQFIEPIPAFIDWIEDSAIAPDTWARYYEPRTNRPIYGDRDGHIYYDRDDIGQELANDYGWEDNFDIVKTIALYEAVLEGGHDAFRNGWRPGNAPPEARQIEAILDDQDEEGRWLTDGRIEIATFVANMEALAAYLRDQ